MGNAVIVEAIRTALAGRNGALATWHPVDLAGEVVRAVTQRSGIDPGIVDDVIVGCVTQTGEQGLNLGRNVALAAGLPDSVPGTTVDRQCGSAETALHFAAQGVMAGAYDAVIAAGVESTSRVPMGSTITGGPGRPFGPRMTQRYSSGGGLIPQGPAAEGVAERWSLSRPELDAFSFESCRRATAAAAGGHFADQIVGVVVDSPSGKKELATDDGAGRCPTLEDLSRLRPQYQVGGVITAGNSAQMADGAAAVLVMSESAAERLGCRVRARFVAFATAAVDPLEMLTAPIPATTTVLRRAAMTLDQVDLCEVDEMFAAAVLAWARHHQADLGRVNVNGGAIALGAAPGCSGVRLTATLLGELERRRARFGLQTMGGGGGTGTATIIERLG